MPTRPLKEGSVTTYQAKVAAGFPDILASEMDADLDTIYAAWNGGVATANLANGAVTTPKLATAPNGVGTTNLNDLAVTNAKLAAGATVRGAVTVALPLSYLSGSGGAWVNVATTPAMVTRGGPVLLTLICGGSILTNSTSPIAFYFGFYRDGVAIVAWRYQIQSATSGTTFAYMPPPSFTWVDPAPSAASHTYGFWVVPPAGAQFATPGDSAGQLVATELG